MLAGQLQCLGVGKPVEGLQLQLVGMPAGVLLWQQGAGSLAGVLVLLLLAWPWLPVGCSRTVADGSSLPTAGCSLSDLAVVGWKGRPEQQTQPGQLAVCSKQKVGWGPVEEGPVLAMLLEQLLVEQLVEGY